MEEGERIIAPWVFCAELGNAHWKLARAGVIDAADIGSRIEQGLAFVDFFVDERKMLPEIVHEAVRFSHPVYDMIYVVLARHKAATLFTLDQKLMAICREAGVSCVEAMKLRDGEWV